MEWLFQVCVFILGSSWKFKIILCVLGNTDFLPSYLFVSESPESWKLVLLNTLYSFSDTVISGLYSQIKIIFIHPFLGLSASPPVITWLKQVVLALPLLSQVSTDWLPLINVTFNSHSRWTRAEVSEMSILEMPALCDIMQSQELKQQPGTECVLQCEASVLDSQWLLIHCLDLISWNFGHV